MMYISGVIDKTIEGDAWVCTIRTPRLHVTKVSWRSRMEALTEALKYIGLPIESD